MQGVRLKTLLVIAASICAANGLDYVIVGPKRLQSNTVFPVSILCRNATSDIKVDLTLQPAANALADPFSDSHSKFSKSFVIKPDQLSRLELNIGDVSTYPLLIREMDLIINGSDSSDFFTRTVTSVAIKNDKPGKTKKQFAFIQTDQPLYKAMDTIQFRVITVDEQLLPVYVPFTVRVLDPGNNIVKQYTNVSDPNVVGYFAGEFLLSAEPLLGAWKVEVRSSDLKSVIGSKNFSVDEYVLPRFDVKIVSTPTYVAPSDTELAFFVEANYTFGEPVKGKLDVTVRYVKKEYRLKYRKPSRWTPESSGRSPYSSSFGSSSYSYNNIRKPITIADFNGRSEIRVPMASIIDLDWNRTYSDDEKLLITANFTETLTGQQKNATAVSVAITSKPYKLELLSNKDSFLPGFPYNFRARMSDLTGRPLPPSTKQVTIRVLFYDKRSWWQKQIYSNDPNLNKTGGDIILPIPADGVLNVDIPTPKEARQIYIKVWWGEEHMRKDLQVNGKESPSSSFLDIKPLTESLQSGTTASFGLNMTTRTTEIIQLLVQSNSNDSFLWSDSISEPGSYVSVSIPVMESMGSTGRLIVYYIRADKEIVGNILLLTPALASKNNVTVSAETQSGLEYAGPGEEALFKAQTSPDSFVAFLAVDESLLLLKTGNDVSANEINAAISQDKFVLPQMYSTEDYFEKAYPSGQFFVTNDRLISSTESGDPSAHITLRSPGGRRPGGRRGGREGGSRTAYSSSSSSSSWGAASSSSRGGFYNSPLPAGPPSRDTDPTTDTGDSYDTLQSPSQTRKDFRQSFLFETAFANSDGSAELRSKVPDAVTTWRISALSLSNTTGLGLTTTPAKLKVFKPFFAVLNLPFSIVRFENLTAEVLVFNYLSQQQDVTVELEIRNPDRTTSKLKRNVIAKPNEGATAVFSVIPTLIGDLTLKVTARSKMVADQLEKTLPVKPEGVKQYFSKPVFIDLRETSNAKFPVTLPIDPAGKVAGSDRVEVRVVGDILGAAMNNLDNLILLPTGCGEQNMAKMTPNVAVAKYLKQINRFSESQKSDLTSNIQLGYQRQLNYRHSDNSYSAWGKSDPKGSTWLTAYVARVFAEATEFVPSIEDDVVKTALRFLIDQQKSDGSFEENGKVIDKQHQGGASSGIALTAFCILSFLQYKDPGKAAVPKFDESVQQATSFLESKFSSLSNDSYSLAITAYALARAKSAKSPVALDMLEQKMIRNSSLAYWTAVVSLSDQGADSDHSYPTNAKDVEATAYALLTYMAHGKATSSLPVVSWLISKQNAQGGFYSAQDTVVGLMALAEFAKVFAHPPSLQLDISYDRTKQSVSLTPQNAVVLQTVEVPAKPVSLSLNVQGSGVALAYVSWTYHVARPAEDVAFDLNVTTAAAKSDLQMGICSRYLREGSSSMAVIEVNTLSGYQFDEDEIRKLPDSIRALRKTEMENKDTKLNLYFDQFEQAPTCFKLAMYRIYKVKDLKDASIVVYDYYNPKERRTVSYSLA